MIEDPTYLERFHALIIAACENEWSRGPIFASAGLIYAIPFLYLNRIVKRYFKLIPSAQRHGLITGLCFVGGVAIAATGLFDLSHTLHLAGESIAIVWIINSYQNKIEKMQGLPNGTGTNF